MVRSEATSQSSVRLIIALCTFLSQTQREGMSCRWNLTAQVTAFRANRHGYEWTTLDKKCRETDATDHPG